MNMHQAADTPNAFRKRWNGWLNFPLAKSLVPFSYRFPPLDRMVDAVRRDEEVRILSGKRGDRMDETDISRRFRSLPIQEALDSPFQMSHFDLSRFQDPGGLLEGLEEQVMVPWKRFLRSAGFTWRRCFPILFFSGPGCATNYHMDLSHVLAWQIYGTKHFHGLTEPGRWAPLDEVVQEARREELSKPRGLRPRDVLTFVMKPGDCLWNQLLTPHWVEASSETAVSLNLSHGGLRCQGRLAPQEQALEEWWKTHPDEVWLGPPHLIEKSEK